MNPMFSALIVTNIVAKNSRFIMARTLGPHLLWLPYSPPSRLKFESFKLSGGQTVAKKPAKKKFTKGEIAGLKARALKLWHADSIGKNSHAMALGKALVAVRVALRGQRGAFKKWWQDYRLDQSRVSYCMDLANGTLDKRKKKAKSARHTPSAEAMRAVSKPLGKLFHTCASGFDHDPLSLLAVQNDLVDVINATFIQVASLAGWKLNRPEFKNAETEYKKALGNLIVIASGPGDHLKKAAAVGHTS
jgi:hypothetical protein